MFSDKRIPLRPVLAIAFFATMLIAVPSMQGAFAHGGMQPPAADFQGKKASIFLKLDPPVITDPTQPVLITARFFDEKSNENFKEVSYRIFFKKDGKEIPIQTFGGEYGGQGLFYDPDGELKIKVIPKDTPAAVAKGEPEIQYGGIWNRGDPIVVEGPVFTEPGLYNLFVEIHTVNTTRTQVAPILQYDVWVTPGREQTIDVSQDGQTVQVKVRNYYGAIEESSYDAATKTVQFSMPFDWKSEMVSKIGMLHTEIFIPKELSDFDKQSLHGTVNGIDTPVFVDNYGAKETVVHFTISKKHLEDLAAQINSQDRTPAKAIFALNPPDPDKETSIMQLDSSSASYNVVLTIPEAIFPEQPIPVGVTITDKSGNPVSAATYELAIFDGQGNEISRSGGVTTPEGISSQDVAFNAQGSFTMKVEKINATSEATQSSIQVIPEFPVGIASVAAALGIMGVIVYMRKKKD